MENGLADIENRERERCVRGRDTIGRASTRSRDAPGEQQDQDDEEGRHAPSLHARVPAGKTLLERCGEPQRSTRTDRSSGPILERVVGDLPEVPVQVGDVCRVATPGGRLGPLDDRGTGGEKTLVGAIDVGRGRLVMRERDTSEARFLGRWWQFGVRCQGIPAVERQHDPVEGEEADLAARVRIAARPPERLVEMASAVEVPDTKGDDGQFRAHAMSLRPTRCPVDLPGSTRAMEVRPPSTEADAVSVFCAIVDAAETTTAMP